MSYCLFRTLQSFCIPKEKPNALPNAPRPYDISVATASTVSLFLICFAGVPWTNQVEVVPCLRFNTCFLLLKCSFLWYIHGSHSTFSVSPPVIILRKLAPLPFFHFSIPLLYFSPLHGICFSSLSDKVYNLIILFIVWFSPLKLVRYCRALYLKRNKILVLLSAVAQHL